MALIKEKIVKGMNCPYHKIVDCNVKTGFVGVASYVNKEAAKVRENMVDGRTSVQVEFPVEEINPLAYAYEHLKASKMSVVEEGSEEEPVETNWFADAVDEI